MRKAVVVLLSVLALLAGVVSVADAAAKPAYKVTLKTSVAKSTAERFISVSGKVTGPGAAGKSVTIQRRYVGGPWITVATAAIRSSGKYTARVETPRGGTTSFRALKGRSSSRRAGVSAVRAIPVYEWLNLAHLSGLNDDTVQPGVQETIGGETFDSVDFFADAILAYKLVGLCTKLTAIADYQYRNGGNSPASIDFGLAKFPMNGSPATPTTTVVNTGTPFSVLTSLVGIRSLTVYTGNYDAGYVLVLGNPRVYCNADHLPAWTQPELT